MKKLLSLLLCLVLMACVGSTSIVNASQIQTDSQPKSTYLENSNSSIEVTDPVMKEWFQQNNRKVISMSTTITNMPNSTSSGLSTDDLIPTSKLQQTLYVSVSTNQSYARIFFTLKEQWLIQPAMHMQDKMALAWSDNLTLQSTSCLVYNVNTSVSYLNSLAEVDSEKGCAYMIPNQPGDGYYIMDATVDISDTHGSANVVGNYAHKTIGFGGITASFSSAAVTFGASLGTFYDTAITVFKAFDY